MAARATSPGEGGAAPRRARGNWGRSKARTGRFRVSVRVCGRCVGFASRAVPSATLKSESPRGDKRDAA